MKDEKYYRLGEDAFIPWIFFGTGIVKKYTRNPYLRLKTIARQALSSLKHRSINKELYINIHIAKILEEAYKTGFRGFDTARIYGYSENEIGRINKKYGDLWLNTKCSLMDIERKCSPPDVAGNLTFSKRNLNTETVGSLLLHWPEGDGWIKIYKDIIEEYKHKNAKAYGICNARFEDLEIIQKNGLPLPMIIQNEIHPLNVQSEIRAFCKNNGIILMAHTPTARMCNKIRNNTVLNELANKYNKSIAQIIIRWHYQNDVIPVVSTTRKEHMKENLNIFDFKLMSDEMERIDKLDQKQFFIKTRGIDDSNYIYNH